VGAVEVPAAEHPQGPRRCGGPAAHFGHREHPDRSMV